MDGEEVATRVEDPWQALPLWPPPGAETAGLYGIEDGSGAPTRALHDTVADTWHWLRGGGPDEGAWWRVDTRVTPIDPEDERELLAEARRAAPAARAEAEEPPGAAGKGYARRLGPAAPRLKRRRDSEAVNGPGWA